MTTSTLEQAADLQAAVGGATVAHRLLATATEHGDQPAMSWQTPDGSWATATWAEVRADVLALAAGLVELGVEPGQTVAFMMGNRPEHVLADQGALHAGAVGLTVYATLAPEQVAFIAHDAGAVVAILEGTEQLARWSEALAAPDGPHHVVVLDPDALPEGDRYLSWVDLLARGRAALEKDPGVVEERWRSRTPDDVVTLLYTSGTTGLPKGVLLTHANVLYECEAVHRLTGLGTGSVSVSYLPYAHIAERNLGIYLPIHVGGHVWFCPDATQLAGVLAVARPTSFFAVPRVWEKLRSALQAGLALQPEQAREKVAAAMDVARRHVESRQRGGVPAPELEAAFRAADEGVLSGLRALLGLDRTEWFSSASAPLPPDVARFFAGLGIVICDVYGMTETTGAVTVNSPDAFALGTVGRPLPGCEVAIAEDGEILLRGPLTTRGYLHRDDLTADLLDSDGWVHTGDVGAVDADGYLTIVDRKKELLITSAGENIAPALIENLLKEDALIGQALAYGDGRKYVTALLALDGEAAQRWAAEHGKAAVDVTDPELRAAVAAAVDAANARLARVQQVKRWHLLATEWTAESEELTPTLKLRRRVIHDKYAAELDALYDD
ncbi:MAG: long-chain fatty acid--CoA ligase [Mycobacteriales bacterium]